MNTLKELEDKVVSAKLHTATMWTCYNNDSPKSSSPDDRRYLLLERAQIAELKAIKVLHEARLQNKAGMSNTQQAIADAISNYCEGINHLEFDKAEFPEMTKDIIKIVETDASLSWFGHVTETS